MLTLGCTRIGAGPGTTRPLAIGAALMAMIFAGGHYNPAVSLGVWIRAKCRTQDVAPSMLFQPLGGGRGSAGGEMPARGRIGHPRGAAPWPGARGGVAVHLRARVCSQLDYLRAMPAKHSTTKLPNMPSSLS